MTQVKDTTFPFLTSDLMFSRLFAATESKVIIVVGR